MANFKVTPYTAAVLENTKLDFQSLYLRRIVSGPNKNQSTMIDRYGNTDFGFTSVNNWAIYDGASEDAKLVARAKGMRMNAVNWCNFFTIVFEFERYYLRPDEFVYLPFLSCNMLYTLSFLCHIARIPDFVMDNIITTYIGLKDPRLR